MQAIDVSRRLGLPLLVAAVVASFWLGHWRGVVDESKRCGVFSLEARQPQRVTELHHEPLRAVTLPNGEAVCSCETYDGDDHCKAYPSLEPLLTPLMKEKGWTKDNCEWVTNYGTFTLGVGPQQYTPPHCVRDSHEGIPTRLADCCELKTDPMVRFIEGDPRSGMPAPKCAPAGKLENSAYNEVTSSLLCVEPCSQPSPGMNLSTRTVCLCPDAQQKEK